MIPVCMDMDMRLVSGDGLDLRWLYAGDPSRPEADRVYLVMEEMLHAMVRDSRAQGIAKPQPPGREDLCVINSPCPSGKERGNPNGG